jgi:hypothetical protein
VRGNEVNINLTESGCERLSAVLSPAQCGEVAGELTELLAEQSDGVIEGRSKRIVGGRNLQSTWAGWRRVCEVDSVNRVLRENLGDQFGLVRILFFDKPPGQSWNLAVHRDRTIAVAQHHDPPQPYGKPTRKAGVPHVAADETLLEKMLTLRLHLDAMHSDNGPLVVVPGSHRDREKSDRSAIVEIHCGAGDVFVMRPLLLHGSRATVEGCPDHRRVVHLEFAPSEALADPYRWFRYDAV